MPTQRIMLLTTLTAVLTAVSAFFSTKVVLASMEPDVWLWDASFATVNNVASTYRSEVSLTASEYSTNGFPMPVLANPYRGGRPCDGAERLISFYELNVPLNTYAFYGAATAMRVSVNSQTGCQIINCDSNLPDVLPNNNCSKSVRPNFGDIFINATEIQWFPWPQYTTTHEPGHLLGRGHEIGDIWRYIIPRLDCDPATIMFDAFCRDRWILNSGGTLFNDLQSSDISWIQSNY